MTTPDIAPRWKAFGIHLLCSLLVLAVILAILIYIWYPGMFIDAGGWQGIRIVTGVDLVLGPLITLIIYNPAKKHLIWDMTAVVTFQICCLTIGVYIVHSQKPGLLILSDEGIHTIHHSDLKRFSIDRKDLPATPELHGIPFYIVDLPEEGAYIVKGNAEIFENRPFYTLTQHYLPFDWQLEPTQRYLPEPVSLSNQPCYKISVFSEHRNFEACLTEKLRLLPVEP